MTRRAQQITIPPGSTRVETCLDWPECGCDPDCERMAEPRGLSDQQMFYLAMLFVIAVCGLALLWLWVR